MIQLALFEPEIPQNTGTLIRFAACMGIPIHIIEPCGFVFSDKNLLRSGMDYIDLAVIRRHPSWHDFITAINSRQILIDPQAPQSFHEFTFEHNDVLILGKESTGFPQSVKETIATHVKIPMLPNRRSLNVALAGGIVAMEAMRQINHLPHLQL